MELPNGQFNKEKTFESNCDGRVSTLTFKILTNEDMLKQGYLRQPDTYYPPYISQQELNSLNTEEIVLTSENIIKYKNKFSQFKKEKPQDYIKMRECMVRGYLGTEFPSPSYYKKSPQEVMDTFPVDRRYYFR